MSTHSIHLKYRTPKRYPTIISIVPPDVALVITFRGSNYRCLEQIFMVPKGFGPSKFDYISFLLRKICYETASKVPQQGPSNEYHNICFPGEIRQKLSGYSSY